MIPVIAAVDCDLHMSYCARDDGGFARDPRPVQAVVDAGSGDLSIILFEIASPVSFNRQDGANRTAIITNLAKWAIWNAAMAERVTTFFNAPGRQVLVAPSNVWTHGYDLKTRHAMAKCKLPKKDLRECEAMIWFYKQRPADWLTLEAYLANL